MEGSASEEADVRNAQSRAERFLCMLTDRKARGGAAASLEVFDVTALAGIINVHSEGPGHARCEFPVTNRVSNVNRTLHGGCTATLIDTVGSAALATMSNQWGVSTHISSEYLAGLPVGDVAVVDARVLSKGNKLCSIEVKIYSQRTGGIVAAGVHQKYLSMATQALDWGTPPAWTGARAPAAPTSKL